jgi:DNA-binding MarR family transcriptional regulator
MLRALEWFGEQAWVDIQAQTIRTLLEVAVSGELPMQELVKRLGVSGAAVSRNVDVLSEGKIGHPGKGWLEVNVDPGDRRIKRVRLTAKGRAVVDKLTDQLRSFK